MFAYDRAKVDFLKSLGCYDPALTDKENAERMADTLFVKNLTENILSNAKKKLRLNRVYSEDTYRSTYSVSIINDNDFDIPSGAYNLKVKHCFNSDGPGGEGFIGNKNYSDKVIPQNSSVTYTFPGFESDMEYYHYFLDVKFDDAETLLKLYTPMGNEYKEYLEGKNHSK